MSSMEEEPNQKADGRSTGVIHKMSSHQNVNEDFTYGYREAEEVSKGYEEESSYHKNPDGDVYGYKEPEDVIKGFEEEPHSHDYEKPEDVYGYTEPEEVRFSYKPKGCTSAANIWGRLKSYKCPRPSLLRVIAVVIPVVAFLGAGACVLLYLTKAFHGETTDPTVKEDRLLQSRMVSPAMSEMTPAQAWLATTLPDTTTELPQMADQSTSLPGVIPTDKTDTSTNKETALLTTEGDLTYLSRPPPVRAKSFGHSIHVPRCENGYRLLVGICIKLVGRSGIDWIFGKSHDGAKEACRKEGATLAMPKTKELDVALRDLEKKGTWYWVDGSKVGNNGYTGWNLGDPSNPRWPPLCGQYWKKSSGWLSPGTGYVMWNDDACFKQKRFICQRPPA
ncbi:hypothetical protein Bbelb_055270 [Branchiostoma belcheri]|nr:hypothetical protein Bbelb_055270 [Branchiostoma belcheri]